MVPDSCFCHPHVHSRNSMRDGLAHIEDLIAKAALLGQPGMALTDHGVLFGMPDLFKAAKAWGIRAIGGMEAYEAAVPWDFDMERDGAVFNVKWADLGDRHRYHHITLWALDLTGWKNLVWLHTNSYRTENHPTQRGKPLVSRKDLAEHSEGLMIGLGCIASKTNQALIRDGEDAAYEQARFYVDAVGDRCVMELMANTADQVALLRGQRRVARRLGIECIGSNDVHYLDRKHGVENGAHHTLVKSRRFKKADTEESGDKSDDGFGSWYGSDGFYLKSAAQMMATGFEARDLTNTVDLLLSRVSFDFDALPAPSPPTPQVPLLGDLPEFDAYCLSVYEDDARARRMLDGLIA
ncbi:MAG TPA: PHP domain-containing protein [Solirubrobacter sp.]